MVLSLRLFMCLGASALLGDDAVKKKRSLSVKWKLMNEAIFSSGGFLVLCQIQAKKGFPITVVSSPFVLSCQGRMTV